MKKTRKFISIFAILFAIVLAFSVCFFAACKGGSDDGGNSGDTGTQQGDDTGSGSGDGSGSGSGTDGSGSGSGIEDGSESGAGQTVTQVVYLATSADKQYTTAGDAVFTNESDLKIDMSSDGLTYTVSGTASTMGEAEAEWYATDDVEEGTPYVVIKIAVAEGESIYYENSGKTYTNDEAGKGDFDDGYIFIVCKLSFEDDKCVTETKYDITPVEGEKVTYTVSFSGVNLPEDTTPAYDPSELVYSLSVDFSNHDEYSGWITGLTEESGEDENTEEAIIYWDVTAGTYTTGILSFTAISGQTINKDGAKSLFTASNSTASNFKIDLTGLEGDYITIEVAFCANGSSTRDLYVSSSSSTSGQITKASAPGKEETTLSYGQSITAEDTALYLVWTENLRIFSIDINLYGEVEPDFSEDNEPHEAQEYNVLASYVCDSTGLVVTYQEEIPDAGKAIVTYSSETAPSNNKSGEYNGTTYSYGLNIGSTSKYLTIVIPDGATEVSITAVVFDSSGGRPVYLGTNRTATQEGEEGFIASDTSVKDTKRTMILEGTNLTGGTYYIFAGSDSVYLNAVFISYTVTV